jgi:hypothetical protein
MEYTYCIVATKIDDTSDETEVLHLCYYTDEPNEVDISSLVKELAEEEEFGMVGMEFNKDYEFEILSSEDEFFQELRKILNGNEEN